MRANRRLAALVLLGVLLLGAAHARATAVQIELSGGQWSPGGPPLVRVKAEALPIPTVVAAVERATGVRIGALPADLAAARITLDTGPLPLERIVRQLVRPHGLAAFYGTGGQLTSLVVVPIGTGEEAPLTAAAEPPAPERLEARVDGTWWRLEDVGHAASPEAREAALLTLGGALDDPSAVALLEAAADGRAGLALDDPARRLARRILAARPGSDEEEDGEAAGGG